ncbi:MAG: LacI family transcriptional regulator [Clostridium sp.]|nr:LacI family transcriptional regulator [Clostridium sp.]
MVTIYDIAKEAKVSPATVSRVISGSARVSPEKERIVRGLIEKYHFRPNAIAKSLIGGQSRIIGLLVADIRNPFYAELSVACEKAAKQAGYHIMLRNVFNDDTIEDDSLEMFVEHRVDAIIQLGCRVDALVSDARYVDHVNKIAEKIPFVSTGSLDGGNSYVFGIDNNVAMDQIFEYLRGLGHKKIAFIGGWINVRSTYEKWTRYVYLHGKYGIALNQNFVQEGGYGFPEGYACMKKLLALGDRPTAVIVVNDYAATGALSAIREEGLSVPGDFSVVSYDNTFLAEITMPRLTSVDYGYETLGAGLVRSAVSLINQQEVPRVTKIAPQLRIKDSCKPIFETDNK